MLKAAFIINEPGKPPRTRAVEDSEQGIAFGRATNNNVIIETGDGVAHYHAVVERRDDGFWILNTPHPTKVNGEALVLDHKLADGDRITLGKGGGACVVDFFCGEVSTPGETSPAHDYYFDTDDAERRAAYDSGALGDDASSETYDAAEQTDGANSRRARASDDSAGGGLSPALKIALGVLAVSVILALAYVFTRNSGCRPTARLVSPSDGAALQSAVTVRVQTDNTHCIKRVVYRLDGDEVASAAAAPYDAALYPERLAARFRPGKHVLTVLVETRDGEEVEQSEEVSIALGAGERAPEDKPPPTPPPASEEVIEGAPGPAEVQQMAERLAGQLSGKSGYVFEAEMISDIQARTREFASVNAPERVAADGRVIRKAFRDQGIDNPLLGFVLALSRSKFEGAAGSDPWRVPPDIAQGYTQTGEATGEPGSRRRASEVAAVYLKALLNTFDGEFDLAVACYGCTIEEAGELDRRLKSVAVSERRNFWRLVKLGHVTPAQAERLVRFYAAGVVAENPQRFSAAARRPLSALD